MTGNLGSLEGLAERPTAESGRFDHVSIALHWLTVLFIMG
jgi:hypothetical protein